MENKASDPIRMFRPSLDPGCDPYEETESGSNQPFGKNGSMDLTKKVYFTLALPGKEFPLAEHVILRFNQNKVLK